ncbi:hypothetical protein ACQKC8_10215 [Stutzerimonas stutzeri]|uniref:hypothetical protein n=1 Tax=Stutzerimonas stutzeri TaxID=316 RepID=UPI003C2D08A3
MFALFSCVLLVICGLCYGAAFMRKKNYLLGVEYLIVGISAMSFTIFIATGWQANYNISIFLDAFSRGVGVPVIGILGLMAVTHGYKPSFAKDVLLFVVGFCAAAVYSFSSSFKEILPYFYVLMWSAYTLYLIYFTARLARAGELLHGAATLLGALAGLAIALGYDFFPIPGDETKLIFMTCAFLTWSYSIVQIFYAYRALQRTEHAQAQARIVFGCG